MDKLILGLKGHGKTTVLCNLTTAYKKVGLVTAVLTPVLVDHPRLRAAGAAFVTADRARFIAVAKDPASRGLMLMMDEAGQTVGKYDQQVELFCSTIRHTEPGGGGGGHTMHFAAQRATMMNVNLREQCTELFMLRQPLRDAKLLAEKFGHPGLLKGPDLDPLEYMHCTNKKGSLSRGRAKP